MNTTDSILEYKEEIIKSRKETTEQESSNKPRKHSMSPLRYYSYQALMIFLSGFIYAFHFHYFVSPAMFAPGGVGGIVNLLSYAFKKSTLKNYTSLLFIIVNFPLALLAYKMHSKSFAIKTFLVTLVISLATLLFDNLDQNYQLLSIIAGMKVPDTGIPSTIDGIGIRLLSAILGGAVCGVSLVFAFKINASTGGVDIIAAIIQKRNPHYSVAQLIFIVNGAILVASIFVYEITLIPVFLALIYIYISTVICDKIMYGTKSAVKFEVITKHAQEISEEIILKLKHGVTVCPAVGMYDLQEKSLLICIVSTRQVAKFQRILSRYDDTFSYLSQVNEIIGKFNKAK